MSFVDKMAAAFEDELRKIAGVEQAAKAAKGHGMLVPGMVAGSLGTLALQRMHRDWKNGRAMRMQSGSYY